RSSQRSNGSAANERRRSTFSRRRGRPPLPSARAGSCSPAGHADVDPRARWPRSAPLMIELKQLKTFRTIVEVGSFTGAGERLGISRSAISQQVRALEEELGVTLLL